MINKTNMPPIIIIGMHRSGTTMIASMLRELGLFIGNDLEENYESMFYINHNDWLLHQCGGAWDNPSSIEWLYKDDDLMLLSEGYLRARIAGLPVSKYLGVKKYILGNRPLSHMGQVWGWKDPRMTYTLPIWLRLFPDAKVVHIYRNGVPVAASLRTRDRKHLKKSQIAHQKRTALGAYSLVEKTGGFVWSNRCMTLEGGFSLWEEYVETAMKMTQTVAPQSFSLKYEDFLDNPVAELSKLANYCGLSATPQQIQDVASGVRADRADAHTENEELTKFYESVRNRPLMKALGYS